MIRERECSRFVCPYGRSRFSLENGSACFVCENNQSSASRTKTP
jgi:hypothetical protein